MFRHIVILVLAFSFISGVSTANPIVVAIGERMAEFAVTYILGKGVDEMWDRLTNKPDIRKLEHRLEYVERELRGFDPQLGDAVLALRKEINEKTGIEEYKALAAKALGDITYRIAKLEVQVANNTAAIAELDRYAKGLEARVKVLEEEVSTNSRPDFGTEARPPEIPRSLKDGSGSLSKGVDRLHRSIARQGFDADGIQDLEILDLEARRKQLNGQRSAQRAGPPSGVTHGYLEIYSNVPGPRTPPKKMWYRSLEREEVHRRDGESARLFKSGAFVGMRYFYRSFRRPYFYVDVYHFDTSINARSAFLNSVKAKSLKVEGSNSMIAWGAEPECFWQGGNTLYHVVAPTPGEVVQGVRALGFDFSTNDLLEAFRELRSLF